MLKQIFPGGQHLHADDESSLGAAGRTDTPSISATTRSSRRPGDAGRHPQPVRAADRRGVRAHRKFDQDWLANFLDNDWIGSYSGSDPDTGKEIKGPKALANDTGQGNTCRTAPALRAHTDYTFMKKKVLMIRWAGS